MIDSPLASVTIPELFSTSPEKLTEAQVTQIIDYYRAARERWVAEDKETPKKREPKGTSKPKAESSNLSLDDLGLV